MVESKVVNVVDACTKKGFDGCAGVKPIDWTVLIGGKPQKMKPAAEIDLTKTCVTYFQGVAGDGDGVRA